MSNNINKSIEDYKKELLESYKKSGQTIKTDTSDKVSEKKEETKEPENKTLPQIPDAVIGNDITASQQNPTQNNTESADTDTPTANSEITDIPVNPVEVTENNPPDDEIENPMTIMNQTESTMDMTTGKFRAEVFSGDSAYPVENAKVKVFRNNKLIAFLSTDENGATKDIELQSPPEVNSLEPDNPIQSLSYTADVYADGFITKKNLPVDIVGDTQAILKVNLVPIPERMG